MSSPAYDEKTAAGPYDVKSTSPKLEGGVANDLGEIHGGDNVDGLHRRLKNRQIQLIAIGGSIGTALFVTIGGGLAKGGPGSLFLAYTLYSGILALVNNSIAEMTTHMPVSGGFIRLAGYWFDDALGFAAGWNFFLYEAILIPFEISAICSVLSYWSDDVLKPGPVAGICVACIVLYALLNIIAVKGYGEAEFWLSGGKVILIFLLFSFTFVTMVGGNPKGFAYGFYYWQNPGSFAEFRSTGSLGRFEGFLGALFNAGFTVVGPEYISMVAAEAQRPSVYIKAAFKTVYYRFCVFFIVGSLAIGCVVAYNDPAMVRIFVNGEEGSGTAAASPYVIAMSNLGVTGLPHLVNALMLTSIFSAGNTYVYAATRSLYALALDGRAPKVLRYCNRRGVPIWCFCIVMLFPMLSFLQVSNNSALVITWLVNIVTGGGILNFVVMNLTFINYYKATVVQGFDRSKVPYTGMFQPYGAYLALVFQILLLFFFGYTAFGPPDVENFFTYYSMQILFPILFIGWKLIKKTKYVKPSEVDLVWERPSIDRYEANLAGPVTGFWEEMGHLVGFRRPKKDAAANDA